MKNMRLKAAAVMFVFLIAGVLYSANRSQDLLFYGTEEAGKAMTGETDTIPESDGENEESIAAISGNGQDGKKDDSLTEDQESDHGDMDRKQDSTKVEEGAKQTGGEQSADSGLSDLMSGETVHGADGSTAKIRVHVCGAVRQAGVYLLESNAIVEDAVKAAGGVTKEGAGDYLNLADTIRDGEKIYVPFLKDLEHPYGVDPVTGQADRKENSPSGTGDSHEAGKDDTGTDSDRDVSSDQGKVNINIAGKEELMTLPGIGETRGEAILSYRQEQGHFSCIEDIMKVSGIKEGAFRKIKDRITV